MILRPLFVFFLLPFLGGATSNADLLDSDSVVLITGAAGYLGSELALALHATYDPRLLILVDSLDYLYTDDYQANDDFNHRTLQEVEMMDYQRRRVTRVSQTLGNKAHWYRSDLRRTVTEFEQPGEVPLLKSIFRKFPYITHIVHMADDYAFDLYDSYNTTEELPYSRKKSDKKFKADMMASILGEMQQFKEEHGRVPHFTYASSHKVYSAITVDESHHYTDGSLSENVSSPYSTLLSGVGKLMDETLARVYFEQHDIYSVGLRFFQVYGPWDQPNNKMYRLIDRMIGNHDISKDQLCHGSIYCDYIYIDDAIDAIMSAMQLRPPPSHMQALVMNVGSGQPTLWSEFVQVADQLLQVKTDLDTISLYNSQRPLHANISRARSLLGFEPQISFSEGLQATIAWHLDMMLQAGGIYSRYTTPVKEISSDQKAGLSACLSDDYECHRGLSVYPCASECAHEDLCQPSPFDAVLEYTQVLTRACSTVLYTVDLDPRATSIPSHNAQVTPQSQGFLSDVENGHCNVAFVAEGSPLVHQARSQRKSGHRNVLRHGHWALVPIQADEYNSKDTVKFWEMLPKYSPRKLFSEGVQIAVFCEPNLVFDNLLELLGKATSTVTKQQNENGVKETVAIVIPHSDESKLNDGTDILNSYNSVQDRTYQMLRIALSNELKSTNDLSSAFVIHADLKSNDSHLLRCDIYNELISWKPIGTDESSLQLTLGMHNLYNKLKRGGESYQDKTGSDADVSSVSSRRLTEVKTGTTNDASLVVKVEPVDTANGPTESDENLNYGGTQEFGKHEEEVSHEEELEAVEANDSNDDDDVDDDDKANGDTNTETDEVLDGAGDEDTDSVNSMLNAYPAEHTERQGGSTVSLSQQQIGIKDEWYSVISSRHRHEQFLARVISWSSAGIYRILNDL